MSETGSRKAFKQPIPNSCKERHIVHVHAHVARTIWDILLLNSTTKKHSHLWHSITCYYIKPKYPSNTSFNKLYNQYGTKITNILSIYNTEYQYKINKILVDGALLNCMVCYQCLATLVNASQYVPLVPIFKIMCQKNQ